MQRHIAFFNVPALGHLAPTLGVVEELVQRGHRVSYAATEKYADLVAAAGATVVPYESTVDPQAVNAAGAGSWQAGCLFTQTRESAATAPTFEAYFAEDPPDLVAYEAHIQFLGSVLARRWGRPGVKLHTVAPTNLHVTREQVGDERYDRLEGELRDFAAGIGVSGVSYEGIVTDPDEFNVVFLPRELVRDGDRFSDRYAFVGPCLRAADFQGRWSPPASGHPVVLISLGTIHNGQPEFFRMCAEAFADQPWHVVLALGPGMDPAEVGPLPPNAEAHRWVAMQPVLAHAGAFVCHAGWGSAMHSLHAGTPLLLVPHVGASDHLVGQVRALDLGRVVAREELTAERIRDSVLALAADPAVRRNVDRMRQHIHAAGGAARAVDEMLAHADRSHPAGVR